MIPCRLIFCKTRVRCGKLESVAPVAQWIRASVFGTEGRGFESPRVYHCFKMELFRTPESCLTFVLLIDFNLAASETAFLIGTRSSFEVNLQFY